MAAQKDVLGLIDASREIRRAPLVGMHFLHERTVRTADLLGVRPRLQAKDLVGLLLRHFAGAPPERPAPLPHHPARAHASRASRRSRYATNSARLSSSISVRKPVKVATSSASRLRAFVAAGENARRALRRCRDRAPFREKRSARGRPGPSFSACGRQAREGRRQPAEQTEAAYAKRDREPDPAAHAENAGKASAPIPPPVLSTAAAVCGLSLVKD